MTVSMAMPGPAPPADGRAVADDIEGTRGRRRSRRGDSARDAPGLEAGPREPAHGQRHVRVRRTPGASSTASRGSGCGAIRAARAARSRCCSPAASRVGGDRATAGSPVAGGRCAATTELALGGCGRRRGRTALDGVAATPARAGLRRSRSAALGGAGRRRSPRLGGMAGYEQPCRVRGTVCADGRERRVRRARPARALLGRPGLGPDRADAHRHRVVRRRPARRSTAVRPAGARHARRRGDLGARSGSARRACCRSRTARLSTTYDADGRTRGARASSSGRPGDDEWPRRAAGEVLCGSTLDLGALRLDFAFFRWHIEGRDRRRPLRHPPPRR